MWFSDFEMVRSRGFEPPTPRLGIWCSILLSYERAERFFLSQNCFRSLDPYQMVWNALVCNAEVSVQIHGASMLNATSSCLRPSSNPERDIRRVASLRQMCARSTGLRASRVHPWARLRYPAIRLSGLPASCLAQFSNGGPDRIRTCVPCGNHGFAVQCLTNSATGPLRNGFVG